MRVPLAALASLCLAPAALADIHIIPEPNGPLAGKTVVVSPGHGYLLDGGSWRWQRGITNDVREDVHTNEIVIEYLQRFLANAGARVESCRERSFQTREVVVDDAGSGLRVTGTWSASTSTAGFHGQGYRWAQVDAAGVSATATFQPTIPEAGSYPVYAWFTTGPNRARDARFVVHHAGGRTVVTVDQVAFGSSWVFLGEFFFAQGTAGKVVLENRGADPSKVVIADAVRLGGGVGTSGQPRWRESAKAFLARKGFTSSAGDVTVRPLYATWLAGDDTSRWRSDFLYFALHTNAGGGTGLSSFSYSNGRTAAWDSNGPRHYPTSPSPLETASDALRDRVHAQVLADVRAAIEPSWRDRGRMVMNFGELREARNMPSALLELGFHDTPEDAARLKDARFREVAARAIYKGILRHLAGSSAAVLPLAPDALRVENLGGGRLRLGWDAVQDPLEPSAAPTGFKVYLSLDGRGWDDGAVVAGTSHELTGLARGQQVFVRVAARNQGGESLPSRVAGARVGEPARRALIVDGFDRRYQHTESNIAGRFTYDDAVEHVQGLAVAAPDAAIDCAANEALLRGRVRLAGYALVDWLLGREASLDRTFDPTEQQLLEQYLQAGGTLLASGTELGWDLEARGGGVRFLHDVLGASYARDDAGTRSVRGAAGSPFATLPALTLSDGTRRWAADSCDVFTARAGAQPVLAYETAGAPVAGVGAPRRTLVLGFPIESVTDAARREQLMSLSVDFLAPALRTAAPGGSTPGSTPGGSTPGGSTPNNPGQTGPSAGTAPVGTSSSGTTAAAITAQSTPVGGGGGGGGGCSLAPASEDRSSGGFMLLALVMLLVRRRR